jgi:hypothetical protein
MKDKFTINSDVILGFAIGATIPVLGYVAIEFIFEQLTNADLMSELGSSFSVIKRQRTLAVLAIASNLIPFQILKSKRSYNRMRGIMIATFIYATIWVIYFWDSIMV